MAKWLKIGIMELFKLKQFFGKWQQLEENHHPGRQLTFWLFNKRFWRQIQVYSAVKDPLCGPEASKSPLSRSYLDVRPRQDVFRPHRKSDHTATAWLFFGLGVLIPINIDQLTEVVAQLYNFISAAAIRPTGQVANHVSQACAIVPLSKKYWKKYWIIAILNWNWDGIDIVEMKTRVLILKLRLQEQFWQYWYWYRVKEKPKLSQYFVKAYVVNIAIILRLNHKYCIIFSIEKILKHVFHCNWYWNWDWNCRNIFSEIEIEIEIEEISSQVLKLRLRLQL